MYDDIPLDRLKALLGVPADEPTLPGVIPPEPEQHRLPGMENAPQESAADQGRTDSERGATFLEGLDALIAKHENGPSAGFAASLVGLREIMSDAHPEATGADYAAAIGRDIRQGEGFMTLDYAQDLLPALIKEAQAEQPAPEPTTGNAQFLREEDRTRPMPKPTPSMDSMGLYVGPVYPMRDTDFSPEAWGQYRDATSDRMLPVVLPTPDVADGSPLDRLLRRLDGDGHGPTLEPPPGPQSQGPSPMGNAGSAEGIAAVDEPQGKQQNEPQSLTEPGREARDVLAELLERLDPGHAERTDEQRAEHIEAQLQEAQLGREARNMGRGF
jgi:hypothetical protein